MKSKATICILIAGVVIVWGIIIYRIFSPKEDAYTPQMRAQMTEEVRSTQDTLILDYRDPFLGISPEQKKQATEQKQQTAAKVKVKAQTEPTEHRLRYMGKITKDKEVYALVEINGMLHTMRIGETVDGYRLKDIRDGAVKLIWQREVCDVAIIQ